MISQHTDVNGNGKRPRLSTNDQLAEGPRSGPKICSEPPDNSLVFLTGENLQSLLDVYFTDIHPWIPMIHTATFQRKIRERTDEADIPLILHAILVGALRLLDEKEQWLPADRVQQQIRQSRAKVILSAGDRLSVENLQALTIIAFTHVSRVFSLWGILLHQLQLGDGEPMKAWPIVSSLTRSVEYLQLSVEEPVHNAPTAFLGPDPLPPPDHWVEEEERRRVFWNIFILDRYVIRQADVGDS